MKAGRGIYDSGDVSVKTARSARSNNRYKKARKWDRVNLTYRGSSLLFLLAREFDGFRSLSLLVESKYPASVTLEEIKHECPVFADNVCPFSKLTKEHKGAAGKCPAFKDGCPFKDCKTVGQFEHKLGQMRDQCKGDPAYLEFLRETHVTAKEKEAIVGPPCPFFHSKAGCPFAKDTSGKPILSPDYIVTPMGITLNDVIFSCPAFGKAMCPYAILVTKCKGLAANCPAFDGGCPFKICTNVGQFVEKLTQMRDTCLKGKAAHTKFFKELFAINSTKQEELGNCPFNAHVCPFSHDAQGKAIVPK